MKKVQRYEALRAKSHTSILVRKIEQKRIETTVVTEEDEDDYLCSGYLKD